MLIKSDPALVSELLSEVFGKFAMMFADACSAETRPADDCPLVLSTMSFKGPESGVFELLVPEACCPEITANVLGYDPSDEFVLQNKHDGIKELLNVIGGNLLMKLTGEGNLYDVGIPAVEPLPGARWGGFAADPQAIVLSVDDRPVLFRMKLEAGRK